MIMHYSLCVLVLACLCLAAVPVSATEKAGIFNKLFSFFRSAAPVLEIQASTAELVSTVADSEPPLNISIPSAESERITAESLPIESVHMPLQPVAAVAVLPPHLLIEANDLIQQKRYREAIDALLTILELDPNNVEANGALGAVFLVVQEPKLAESFLYTAVKESGWKDLVFVSNLAECLRLSGELELAEKTAVKGLSSDASKDITGLLTHTLANIYLSKEQYSVAADWFLSAASKQRTNLDTWILASTLRFPPQFHDYKLAENVLLEALSVFTESASVHYHLGIVMFNTKRYIESVAFFDKALIIDPLFDDAGKAHALAVENIGSARNDYHSGL
jgi:tetratricopeptide (TPR) repeat protein